MAPSQPRVTIDLSSDEDVLPEPTRSQPRPRAAQNARPIGSLPRPPTQSQQKNLTPKAPSQLRSAARGKPAVRPPYNSQDDPIELIDSESDHETRPDHGATPTSSQQRRLPRDTAQTPRRSLPLQPARTGSRPFPINKEPPGLWDSIARSGPADQEGHFHRDRQDRTAPPSRPSTHESGIQAPKSPQSRPSQPASSTSSPRNKRHHDQIQNSAAPKSIVDTSGPAIHMNTTSFQTRFEPYKHTAEAEGARSTSGVQHDTEDQGLPTTPATPSKSKNFIESMRQKRSQARSTPSASASQASSPVQSKQKSPHKKQGSANDKARFLTSKVQGPATGPPETERNIDRESISSRDGRLGDRDSVTPSETSMDVPQSQVETTPEAVRDVLKDVYRQLRAWQETKVQAELRKATIDARNRPMPRVPAGSKDPFAALIQQRRPAAQQFSSSAVGSHSQIRLPKEAKTIRAPAKSFSAESISLPKYKAIGRTTTSMLAPNYETAKYNAYEAEDETDDPGRRNKYEEFEDMYKIDLHSLKLQRNCQERIWLWQPWFPEVLSRLQIAKTDILHLSACQIHDPPRMIAFGTERFAFCRTCKLMNCWYHRNFVDWEDIALLPMPDDRTVELTGILAAEFHRLTGVSLWHFAISYNVCPPSGKKDRDKAREPELCLICFRHECPDHGTFVESQSTIMGAYINDSEKNRNQRRFISLPTRTSTAAPSSASHSCGIFCVPPDTNLRQILGRQTDHSVGGEFRPQTLDTTRALLADDELCHEKCCWEVDNRDSTTASRVKFQVYLSPGQKVLVEKLIPFYLSHPRGPCLIARIIKDVDCRQIFNNMIFRLFERPHPGAEGALSGGSAAQEDLPVHRKKKGAHLPLDTSNSAELINRPPFIPCAHDGPCLKDSDCSCAKSYIHCERFCGCEGSCKRRFQGCVCKSSGKKICFEDSRCECWANSRECDPALCGRCGVVEVLNSANKYNEQSRIGRCKNNRIQLGLPAPTTKAPSQVQGYGLYSRTDIPKHDFIGEYTGEIVSRTEADRRGTIYHLINQEYLFNLNSDQEIDASRAGNKMRFMNNSQREEHINVEAKSLLCSGVVRIGLFAKKEIEAGTELLWKYGYDAQTVKMFWEPGEKPTTERAVIPFSKDRVARSTGKNKLVGERAPSSNGAGKPQAKRKREATQSPPQEVDHWLNDGIPLQIENEDDSDYKTNGHMSEVDDSSASDIAEESAPGTSSGSHDSENDQATPRGRMINPGDQRIGGEAQRRAWVTRKGRR